MFTFSFGSAFAVTAAAPADTYAKVNVSSVYSLVTKAQEKVEAAIDKAEADALYAIFAGKTTVKLGTGNLEVSYDQVKAYYDSEIVAKAKAQASKEASAIYAKIQEALNDTDTQYIGVVDSAASAGKWDDNTGYNVYIGFTGSLDGTGSAVVADDFKSVFDKDALDSGSKAKDIAKEAYAVAVTNKLAEIAAIDETAYIAKDQDAVKALKAKASKLATVLGNRVANNGFDFTAVSASGTITDLDQDLSAAGSAFIGRLNDIYVPAVNEQVATGKLATELAKLTLSADEPTQAAKLAWAQTQVLAKLEEAITAEYKTAVDGANKDLLNESLKGSKADQTKIDAANETIEKAKAQKDAAMEIATFLVGECDELGLLINEATPFANSTPIFGTGTFTSGTKTYYKWNYASKTIASPMIKTAGGAGYYTDLVKVVGYVQAVKDDADALKADIAIDGTIAVDIDDLLEDAIYDTYVTGARQYLPSNTVEEVLHERKHALTGEDCFANDTANDTVKVSGKKYATVHEWNEANYEGARWVEVYNIKADTIDAIMNAATIEDAEAAFLAGIEKYNAVLDKDDKAMNQSAKAFKDLQAKYEKQLEADLDYTIAGIKASGATNNVANKATYLDNLKKSLAKAYTTDELTEKYTTLSAEVKALKDKATLDAEKAALEERCKAYSNVNVTEADKEAIVALRNDVASFRDYAAKIGATYTVADYGLNNKVVAIMNIEAKAIADAYKAINKDGKATLDEAEAVAALRDAFDTYNDEWDDFIGDLETGHGLVKTAVAVTNLPKFEEEIFVAEVDAVATAIAKLPANGSDVAGIKAAREAYDALTLCQRVILADKYYDKLVDMEKLIAENVQTLKITASSTAAKGSITVKWTVEGDATAADGYQVWRSTKHSSGYKKMFTTSKTSYKNTKGLKKGTRYYYKVRAYKVVDGKNVYSDWSNKARRIAK